MRRQCADLLEIQLPETIVQYGSAGFTGIAAAAKRTRSQVTELRQTGICRSGGNGILFRQKTEARTADDRSAFLQTEGPAAEAVETIIVINIGLQPRFCICGAAEDRTQKTGGFGIPAEGSQNTSLARSEFADDQTLRFQDRPWNPRFTAVDPFKIVVPYFRGIFDHIGGGRKIFGCILRMPPAGTAKTGMLQLPQDRGTVRQIQCPVRCFSAGSRGTVPAAFRRSRQTGCPADIRGKPVFFHGPAGRADLFFGIVLRIRNKNDFLQHKFIIAHGDFTEQPDDRKGKDNMAENLKVTITMQDGGIMKGELYPDTAPVTVENFKKLADSKFYDGLIFHRVIRGFMIQGGDPKGTGTGGPGWTIKGEFSQNGVKNELKHEKGVLSMARTQDPDSAGSQFFIMHEAAPFLDGAYAAFGRITEGLDVLDRIAETRTDRSDRPYEDQVIASICVE